MFDLVHEMRTRIVTSPAFTGDRIVGAILFEDDHGPRVSTARPRRSTSGTRSASCPFLKIDKGLADEADGVQLMKPMPALDDAAQAGGDEGHLRHQGALGHQARERRRASRRSSKQQFEIARQVLAAGLVPIIEPEVDIHRPAQGRGGRRC